MRAWLAGALLLCGGLWACDNEPPQVAPVQALEGYLPYLRLEALRAPPRAVALDAGDALQGPLGLAVGGTPRAVYVAERNGWRVLRFPVLSESPPSLGAPEVVASVTPGEGAATIPTSLEGPGSGRAFGDRLAVGPGGALVVSGLEGELWAALPGEAVARRLGAGQGGAPLEEGLGLGQVDLRQAQQIAFDAGSGERPAGLVLTARRAVFWAPLAALSDPSAPLRRVAGSGASAPQAQEGPAREVALPLGVGGAARVDSRGDLYLLAPDAGQVAVVRNFLSDDAILEVLAGGGRSLDLQGPPREVALDLPASAALSVVERGEERWLFFSNNTGLARLVVDEAGEARAGSLLAIGLGLSSSVGLAPLGEGWSLLSLPQHGEVRAVGADGAPGAAVAGWRASESPRASEALPLSGRPQAVVGHAVRGAGSLVVSDAATGKLYAWDAPGEPVLLADRDSGADFARFDSLASAPPAGGLGRLLWVQSPEALLAYQPESGAAAALSGPGALRAALESGPRLGDWRPSGALRLVGAGARGEALVWAKGEAALGRLTWLEPWGPQLRWGALPLSLPTAQAADVVVSARDVVTVVLRDPARGDLIVAAPLRVMAGQVAGRPLEGVAALVVAGGGAGRAGDGALAREVALEGVRSAVVVGESLWWLEGGAGEVVTLRRADAGAAISQVSVELAPEGIEEGQDAPLERLSQPPGEARLWVGPCLGAGAALLLGPRGVWWLQPGPGEHAVAGFVAPAVGQARLLWAQPARAASCLEGGLGLLSASGASLRRVPGEEAPLPWRLLDLQEGRGGVVGVVEAGQGEGLALLVGDQQEALTGVFAAPLAGRALSEARLADDGFVWTGAPDGAVYGAGPGALVRVRAGAEGFPSPEALELLWEGAPLEAPTAITAAPGEEPVRLFVASRGVVYRWSPGAPGFARVLGGGSARPGAGVEALEVELGQIEGLAVDQRGDLWVRGGGVVGRLRAGERFALALGGGDQPIGAARWPWELRLSARVGAHPALALDGLGRVVTAEPAQGALLRLTPAP